MHEIRLILHLSLLLSMKGRHASWEALIGQQWELFSPIGGLPPSHDFLYNAIDSQIATPGMIRLQQGAARILVLNRRGARRGYAEHASGPGAAQHEAQSASGNESFGVSQLSPTTTPIERKLLTMTISDSEASMSQ